MKFNESTTRQKINSLTNGSTNQKQQSQIHVNKENQIRALTDRIVRRTWTHCRDVSTYSTSRLIFNFYKFKIHFISLYKLRFLKYTSTNEKRCMWLVSRRSLCQTHIKDVYHLFLQCPFTLQLCNRIEIIIFMRGHA